MMRMMLALLVLLATPAMAAAPTSAIDGAAAYLEGRFAAEEQDLALASERFAAALRVAPGDEMLRRRALEVAITAGDARTAFHHAEALESARRAQGVSAHPGNALVALTAIAASASARSWSGVAAAREGLVELPPRGDSAAVLGPVIDAWTLAARGRGDEALAMLDGEDVAGITRSYLDEHRAHLLGYLGRWPEALVAYQQILAAEGANVPRLRIAGAAAAIEAGDRTSAITILGGDPAQEPLLADARARFARNPQLGGRALGDATGGLVRRPEEGMALLLTRIAADLGRERAGTAALHFARLANFMAPRLPEGWIITADALLRLEQPQLALTALNNVPKRAPWAALADIRRAAAYAQQQDWERARTLLAQMAAEPDGSTPALLRLADLERSAGNLPEAARHYGAALAAIPEDAEALRAQVSFQQGAALEQAGDWAAAEPALREAVRLLPDNAAMLNYLGYSLLDRRQGLDEARRLIEQAYQAAPENGAIIDSMGWAEYVAGNVERAIPLLEQARAAEPGDPTIADHLGDALWTAGRRIEARHMWNSARALDPDEKLAAQLATKLDYGLEAAVAAR